MIVGKEQLSANELRISIEGRIDTTTSPLLRAEIAAIPSSVKKIVLDFSDVSYLSSSGIRELFICKKKFPDTTIENVVPVVFDVLKITGCDKIFSIRTATQDVSTYLQMSFKNFLATKAEHDGDKIVFVDEHNSYTWTDVEECATIIAEDLSRLGATRGSRVAICSNNSANWILTFYAIQKLDATAVLMNFNLRASEIVKTASIGDVNFLCYGDLPDMKDEQNFLSAVRDEADCPIEKFYSIRSAINFKARRDEYKPLRYKFANFSEADNPCTMIFTSGSTGKVKGVILSAYNILNAANVNFRDQTLRGDDKSCMILPFFHIFGLVAGIFANALAGSTIFIPPNIHTNTLLDLISREKCTIFHSVPTMLIALINNKNFSADKLSSLRCTIISGASATEAQIKMFREQMPNNHFLSSYGLSEMAPVSITTYEDSDEHVLHTVGKPVKNIKIKILNPKTGEDCSAGEIGEILVQGFNLMTCYYKLDEADQSIDEDGWLHTGDWGSLQPDGYLKLTGRIKELIIRGGENIMPGEVEAAISKFDFVDNVKVIGVPNDFFGEEVCACIKLKNGKTFDEESFRRELAVDLAKYKIPSRFAIFDEFPMLGSGKIDVLSVKKRVAEIFSRQSN